MNRYLDDLRKWLNCEKEISDRDISDIAVRQMWLEMRRRRSDKQKLRQDWDETVKLDKAVLIAAVGGITRQTDAREILAGLREAKRRDPVEAMVQDDMDIPF